MVFNNFFNNISWYRGGQFYRWRKQEKTTHMPQVTLKNYQIVFIEYTLSCAEFEFANVVTIGTDCIGSCISNYHTTNTGPNTHTKCTLWWFVTKRKTKNECLVYRSCCKKTFVMNGHWRFVARQRLYQMNTTENGFSIFIRLYQISNIFNDCHVGPMWLNIKHNIFRSKLIGF